MIPIVLTSDFTLPAFGAAVVQDAPQSHYDGLNEIILKVSKPADDYDKPVVFNTNLDLSYSALKPLYGMCHISPPCMCRINVQGDGLCGIRLDIVPNSHHLEPKVSGRFISLGEFNDPEYGRLAMIIFAGGGGQNLLEPVFMEQVGGQDGDMTTRATWLYDVKNTSGDTVLEAIDPTTNPHRFNRNAFGLTTKADVGIAHVGTNSESGAKTYAIFWCNEILDVGSC